MVAQGRQHRDAGEMSELLVLRDKAARGKKIARGRDCGTKMACRSSSGFTARKLARQ